MVKEIKHGKIICYTNPTQFDHAPYGTTFITIKGNDETNIYIQTSEITNKPHWECLGNFLDQSLRNLIEDNEFKTFCMKCYKKEISPMEFKSYFKTQLL